MVSDINLSPWKGFLQIDKTKMQRVSVKRSMPEQSDLIMEANLQFLYETTFKLMSTLIYRCLSLEAGHDLAGGGRRG